MPVTSSASLIIGGNHDAATAGLMDIESFNEPARPAILWTRENINSEGMRFLERLGITFKNRHLTLVHGTLQEAEEFHYMFDKAAARATFDLMETNIAFVGHSHIPGMFLSKNAKIEYFCKEKIKISKDEKLIVNVGSIGQPRDGDPRLCYSIYDSDKCLVELKRVSYNTEEAGKKILDKGLPSFLADRLREGI